jgi:hypothetical protein
VILILLNALSDELDQIMEFITTWPGIRIREILLSDDEDDSDDVM